MYYYYYYLMKVFTARAVYLMSFGKRKIQKVRAAAQQVRAKVSWSWAEAAAEQPSDSSASFLLI